MIQKHYLIILKISFNVYNKLFIRPAFTLSVAAENLNDEKNRFKKI
jgi:hypothetical protein